MNRRTIELIASGITLVISSTLLLITPRHVGENMLRATSTSSLPYVLPIFSLSVLVVLSLCWLVQTCLSRNIRMNDKVVLFESFKIRAIITLAILFFGFSLITFFGFITSGIILVALLLVHFGVRNLLAILILCGLTATFIYVFFEVLMKIPLPKGSVF